MDWKVFRELAVLVAAGVIVGAASRFSSIPTRVSVLESQFTTVDKKLDQLILLVTPK